MPEKNPFDADVRQAPAVPRDAVAVTLENAGKRFNRDWIFRRFTFNFQTGVSYAVTGPNGSGKSTLLQTIAGAITPTEGKISYYSVGGDAGEADRQGIDRQEIEADKIYRHIAIAAPYLEVIEEMTGLEFLRFHASFKPLIPGVPLTEILRYVGLAEAANKQIRFFSSGMKQRVKLAQAVFSDVGVVLLDEPCTNLDAAGYALYHRLVEQYCNGKLVIVSSNDPNEYDFCTERISILDYKK